MWQKKIIIFIAVISVTIWVIFASSLFKTDKLTGAPPYTEGDLEPPNSNRVFNFSNWKRPDGPPKVSLQVGHWKSSELPDELSRLKNNTGASGGGKSEWEVNKVIADLTAEILQDKGIEVVILPATIPIDHWSDVFVAIHADGSLQTEKTGFKIAKPRRDYTGSGSVLLSHIESEYSKETGLLIDPNITRNMTGYYAFAWWRYDHAVHPMTTSVILETGFLTSPSDRRVIVSMPEKSAKGLAQGIINYLESQNLIATR